VSFSTVLFSLDTFLRVAMMCTFYEMDGTADCLVRMIEADFARQSTRISEVDYRLSRKRVVL